MLEPGYDVVRDLGVAALAGLAVGIERQWSGHASGANARFAGARTFLLLGLLGGLAGYYLNGNPAVIASTTLNNYYFANASSSTTTVRICR